MTVVRPNSIAGINSITVQTGQALNIHDANGNLIRNITSSTGISTFQSVEVTTGDLTVGISTLFVDKSAARIGIGTNVPDASLSIGDGSTTTYMSLKAGTTNSAVINFGDTADDNIGQFYYYNTDNAFRWTTNTVADRMTLDSSGRLLIGTTTEGHDDSDDLTINGTRTGITIRSASDNYGNIFFSDATSGTGEYVGAVQYYHADNTLRLKTSSADKLIINSAGDVNISGVTTAAAFIPSMGQLSHRNLIINGAMAVNQYGTSSTSSGIKHIDRWAMYAEGANTTLTQSKVDVAAGTAPYQLGFRSAFKILNAGQSNSNVGGDSIRIEQHIEDQMIARSGWDYKSSSSYLTLSFWVKSSVAQDFVITLMNRSDLGTSDIKTYSQNFTIGSTDTWTKITTKIPGSSSLTLDNDATRGLTLAFYMYMGGDDTDSGHTDGAWQAYDGADLAKQQTITWWTTSNSTVEYTGVQLEVGEYATPFEHRGYDNELLRCQRYFSRLGTGSLQYAALVMGVMSSSSNLKSVIPHPVRMRAVPTVTYDNITADDDVASYSASNIQSVGTNTGSFDVSAPPWTCASFSATGRPARIITTAAGGYIDLSAEL